ncbi:MAG: helix-turn-helix domain-containing protein [Clostridiales bacterium]|nr:helix-turn-helix domain-containing protein [Clostridiales bacterium]
MRRELLELLEPVTEEEREILEGKGQVKQGLYTSRKHFTVESEKLLQEGKLISVRKHTRFAYFPLHDHNYVEVFYVCQGAVTHRIDGEEVTVRRGELLFLNQYASHEILPAGREDIAINLIVLPEFFDTAFSMIEKNNVLADFLADSLKEKNGTSRYLYFQVSDNLQIQNLMENLIDSLLHKQGNEEQINRHTMGLLFLHLMNAARSLKESTPNQYRNLLMMTTLRYIEENYRTGSLTQLCDMLNQSISGLSRMIRKSTGYTYKELLQRRRFRKAVELLVETELPVNDIVTAVGYENNSYFYRKFRERYQMTPNAYRERYRGSDRVRV